MYERELRLGYCAGKPIAYVCKNGEALKPIRFNRHFHTWKDVVEFAEEMECKSISSSAGYARNLFYDAAIHSCDLYNAITGEVLLCDEGDGLFFGFQQGFINVENVAEEEIAETVRAWYPAPGISCLRLCQIPEDKPLKQKFQEVRNSTLKEWILDRLENELGWCRYPYV